MKKNAAEFPNFKNTIPNGWEFIEGVFPIDEIKIAGSASDQERDPASARNITPTFLKS
ncbi:hypothetical protein [Burkholderia sp. Leaf177]|uniref:hypothetical protein n=1 Tax=Burkholderia sp. Leaf177 TaxID=1736287 RepID=UPI000A5F81CE|nr:hypothetical protein [Burkholderia sp. Leaf177]